MSLQLNKSSNLNYLSITLLALACLLAVRLVPSLKAPLSSFGYDYGFYLYALERTNWHWQNLLWGGYSSPIFIFGKILSLQPEIFLSLSYFFLSLILGLALYFWLKPSSQKAANFSILLLAGSSIAAESYGMFLYKNASALPFLILSFIFLRQKKYRYFSLTFLIIILLHRTSAIVLAGTTLLYFAWQLIKQKKYLWFVTSIILTVLLIATSYLLPATHYIISNLINNNNYFVRTGLFMQNVNLFSIWWPFLLLGIFGLVLYIKNKQPELPLTYVIFCTFWILLQLPFYRRIFIFADLGVIYFAAYFLSQIAIKNLYTKISLGVVFLFLFFKVALYINQQQPLISTIEVQEIKNFSAAPGFVLATTADDAPWLVAYAKNQRLGAPGLLEDPHTFLEWQEFWQGQKQRQFLSLYPRPLYFYQRSWRLPNFGISNCLKPISENFWQLDYDCLEKTD